VITGMFRNASALGIFFVLSYCNRGAHCEKKESSCEEIPQTAVRKGATTNAQLVAVAFFRVSLTVCTVGPKSKPPTHPPPPTFYRGQGKTIFNCR